MEASLVAVGALLVGGLVGWWVNRSSVKAPDHVGVAKAKQQALEPVRQEIAKADTPKKVADLWNEAHK